MHNFCVKHLAEPYWIVKKQQGPPGAFGGNSACYWGFYNNESSMVKNSTLIFFK